MPSTASFSARVLALAATAVITVTGCTSGTDPGNTLNGSSDETINIDITDFSELPPLDGIAPGDNISDYDQPGYTTLEQYYQQTLNWFDCTEDIQCDYYWVPTDYDNLDAGSTYIAIVRKQATGETPRGSLLMNPGGPGSSGVEFVFGSADYATTPALRAAYDLIGFDPRGVGYSDSVYCGPGEVLDATFLDPGKQYPLGSPADLLDTRQEGAYLAQACTLGTGETLLANIDTVSAAKDMDILRVILGDNQLNYLGFSYGTQLGSAYTALFPDTVGRMVLDGAINPTLTPEESTTRQAGGFETAFTNYIKDCLNTKTCPVDGTTVDDIKTNISAILSDIEENPLPTDLDNELGIWPAIIGIVANLYSQGSWHDLTDGIKTAAEGDGTSLLNSAYYYLERTPDGEYVSTIGTSNHAINCLDDNYSTDPDVIAATNDAITAAAPFFGRFFLNPWVGCAEWPYESNNPALNYTAELANPVLVIGTTGDPATPYQNAVDLAELLTPARLITYDGEGHTVYANRSACVDALVDDYLINGVLPDTNQVCRD